MRDTIKDKARPRLRFAPSPNGDLHLGHAYSVLCNLDAAKALKGHLLLRIDDIDQTRARAAYEKSIIEDCAWLGMDVSEPLRRQSVNLADYQAALERLKALGLIYPTFASRKDIRAYIRDWEQTHKTQWPRDPDDAPHFPKIEAFCKPKSADMLPQSKRLNIQKALDILGENLSYPVFDPLTGATHLAPAEIREWGDIALTTRDVAASYHLSVVVDDAAQGISHIVRGQDLEKATAIHRLLQHLLGLPAPAYHHHPLILGEDGKKLSKSKKAEALKHFRTIGNTPSDIRKICGALLAG